MPRKRTFRILTASVMLTAPLSSESAASSHVIVPMPRKRTFRILTASVMLTAPLESESPRRTLPVLGPPQLVPMFPGTAGWAAAVFAVLTAYIRELGRALGQPADFKGPMAKPQRMAALTVACLVSALEPLWGWRGQTLMIALVIVALGTAFTVFRRTRTLARRLADKSNAGGSS